jgi:hypothetical protein
MRGGGVGIFVRTGLNFKERADLEDYSLKTFENIALEIQYPNKSILISNIYRSPTPPPNTPISDHLDNFLNTLDTHLARLSDQNKHTYIFTDTNINLLKLNESQTCTDYLDTLILNGFVQIINKATRIQNNKSSLIDHIMTNTNLVEYNAGTIIDDISDHFINFLQLTTEKTSKQKQKEDKKRIINETTTANLKNALNITDWTPVYVDNNVDSSFNTFWDLFSSLYEEHCPIVRIKFNINKHRINNFMTEELLEARRLKQNCHKIALKSKSAEDKNMYIQHRNIYNTMLRQCKQKYYNDNLIKNKHNVKRSWQLLKEAANLNKNTSKVDKINKNGNILTDPTEIAEEFNEFFTDIGIKISESVRPTNAKPEDYMPNLQDINNLELGNTNQVHICDIIKSLQPKSSCDIEGISTKLLKSLATEISWPLAHIFNLSLTTGVFPAKLKSSRTVPIFKAGNPELCDNYRPIALLSTLSKILEKMVSVQLVNHLERNNILYKHQYGFQRHKSTEHSIIHAINYINKSMNDNKYCVGVFFDLKKAFDVCSHKILLMKLSKMGITGLPLNGFVAIYLTESK